MNFVERFTGLHFASGGSPVFSSDDRVPARGGGSGGDGLPAELVGKSPAEVATYYRQQMQDQETRLRSELTPAPPPGPTSAEFWNDPTKATDARIKATAMTKEQFDQVSAQIRPSIIWAAKQQCKEAHPDFHRVEARVMDIMSKMPEWQHTNPIIWETVYIQAKGFEHDRLAAEDRAAPPMSAERVSAAGQAPPDEQDLTKVTLPGIGNKTAAHVADKLGVTHESYRKSQKELAGDGLLPMTYDNRGKR